MCVLCGTKFKHDQKNGCTNCGSPCVGYYDPVGGFHEGGCGHMPDGTFCGECSKPNCGACDVWHQHERRRQGYGRWHCEECGAPLEIMLDKVEEERPAEGTGFRYERRHLMWHCTECGCDYENHWETQWGDVCETKLTRKYWG